MILLKIAMKPSNGRPRLFGRLIFPLDDRCTRCRHLIRESSGTVGDT